MAVKIIIPVVYLVLVILHAWYHAYLIEEKNRLITSKQKIWEWGLTSLIFFVSFAMLVPIVSLIILPIVTRLAFFDIVLNWWRGENWLYEGVISKKKSIWDYIEDKIGLPTWFYRILYLVMYAVYLITYFIQDT